ncbi:collagenase [Vibrio cyclitrophicus]|uniref:M9 family metallopeptidase n=1 Tax=Vibrio cyclitrophicus TaxID=47951 RepID=UPI0002E01E83|nr:M9 family metallopeptidase [Vibrio cyclitrophicus]OED70389.1 peptidase M9 [Vibrio cyclitrophicus ZF99]OEF38514.1 peptidase M9 [Vibrio cyclitrophicus 1F289]PME20167.1 peptidase M9 [Vibrio cyclitrophicus]PME74672.1 peptidase M9 [Vibrio cyclitrophicus]PMF14786.1 peptidase M9 [Vibrio cyclitrophicus]
MSHTRLFPRHRLAIACILASVSSFSFAEHQCDVIDLQQAADLALSVSAANNRCYGSWFSAPENALNNIYSEASLSRIQIALSLEVAGYRGEEQQARKIENLGEFVRAAYYVRYNAQAEDFSKALSQRFAQSTNAFLANTNALDQGREQVGAMKSLTLMVDNVKQLPLTMDAQLAALRHFNQETAQDSQWVDGLNNLFRAMAGHAARDDFYDYMASHTQHIDTLAVFARDNTWALDTDASFLVYNAVRETGRLLASPDKSTKDKALRFMQQVMVQNPLGSEHDKLWLAAVEMMGYYAPDGLNGLDLEQAKRDLSMRVLPNRHECQGPAIIRSQDLTQAQSQEACDVLAGKEADFHQIANTGQQPVADDNNERVEVAVFGSKGSYTDYSAFLFGNTTDNGGQYLEGNPSEVGNVARFVAYRYANGDDLSILNLEHEYTHYLDARFNQYGSFNDNLAHGYVVWWLEGFAEFMHYKQGYDAAVGLIRSGKMSLSDVLATTYSHDSNRIYRWGYLAVRFMIEEHPQEVQSLLALSRAGKFSEWAQQVKVLGLQYNGEFERWLDTVSSEPTKPTDPTEPTDPTNPTDQAIVLAANQGVVLSGEAYSEQLFYVDVPENTTHFEVSIEGSALGQSDADLYMSYNKEAHYYDFEFSQYGNGSNEVVTFEPEASGYIQTGRYYMSIAGRTDFNDVKLLASLETETLPPPAQEQDDLTPIIFESGQPQIITVHQRRYAAVYVPEGVQEVRVWLTDKKATQSDTGNVDLFASRSYWPTVGKHEYTSNYTGSNEYLQIPVSEAGYLHFLLSANLEGDDVEMLVYVH